MVSRFSDNEIVLRSWNIKVVGLYRWYVSVLDYKSIGVLALSRATEVQWSYTITKPFLFPPKRILSENFIF
jgi:hypothetical protein